MNAREQIQHWVEKCREVIRRQRLSYQTEKDYCGHLRRYFVFTTRLAKGFTPEEKATLYLNHLASPAVDVSEATQSGAFFAIIYFYKNVLNVPLKNIDSLRCKKRTRERTAPTMLNTHRILDALPDVSGYPTNLQGRMLYARGLRISELLNLRLKDVRFGDRKLVLIAAKGNKDRVVRMDEWMVEPLQRQVIVALTMLERDTRNGVPLEIPHQLAKKYPETKFSKHWEWLFPAQKTCIHPRTGEVVRFRQHQCYLQRAFKAARLKTGVMAIPHEMRHAHATHILESGLASVKALQEEMGHVDPRTTMGYCHADALSVPDVTMLRARQAIITVQPIEPRRLEFYHA